MTTQYELVPLKGVGPFALGMSSAEARAAASVLGEVRPFRRGAEGSPAIVLDNPSLFVYFDPDGAIVDAVEFAHGQEGSIEFTECPFCQRYGLDYQVVFEGRDVFHTPAEQVLQKVREYGTVEDNVGSFICKPLQLAFWRESDDFLFWHSTLIGIAGYFDR